MTGGLILMCHDVFFFSPDLLQEGSQSPAGAAQEFCVRSRLCGKAKAWAGMLVVQAVRLVPLSRAAGEEKETGCKRERAFEEEQLSKKLEFRHAHSHVHVQS